MNFFGQSFNSAVSEMTRKFEALGLHSTKLSLQPQIVSNISMKQRVEGPEWRNED